MGCGPLFGNRSHVLSGMASMVSEMAAYTPRDIRARKSMTVTVFILFPLIS
jgi:hypothetical protein